MGSWPQDRIYCRTASGDRALHSTRPPVPSDYHRILRIIEGDTHPDVIRGFLRQFPDALLADWLTELVELGLVASVPTDPAHEPDFTTQLQSKQAGPSVMTPDDTQRIARQVRAARLALDDAGAFLFPERLENRPRLRKKARDITVLIVEDDPDQAAIANLRVRTAGYAVRVACDCKELVQQIRTLTLPDLVLLDVNLPDGNGFNILASIRRHPKLALLPVVMLTTLADPEDVRRGLDLGADGYITKPYSKKILTQIIRNVLKHA
jgi:CheY-like chemotaxis protein